jgi:formylglycine-generating enzyme required for sulfatase activity
VESVYWTNAVEFVQKLTATDQAANKLPPGFVYVLPTEQQWQYAAADAQIEQAVCSVTAKRTSTADVGTLKPNKFGLYDMLGNVWEWCRDWSGDERTLRILAGGSWLNDIPGCVSISYRLRTTNVAYDNIGFRCVLVAGESSSSP